MNRFCVFLRRPAITEGIFGLITSPDAAPSGAHVSLSVFRSRPHQAGRLCGAFDQVPS